jgi:hypothetical protein
MDYFVNSRKLATRVFVANFIEREIFCRKMKGKAGKLSFYFWRRGFVADGLKQC